jgi:hypothetical protein
MAVNIFLMVKSLKREHTKVINVFTKILYLVLSGF